MEVWSGIYAVHILRLCVHGESNGLRLGATSFFLHSSSSSSSFSSITRTQVYSTSMRPCRMNFNNIISVHMVVSFVRKRENC